MTFQPQHIVASVTHARRGTPAHAFRYRADYVLIDPDVADGPWLFSRNRFNLASVNDRSHGGAPGHGSGVGWARARLRERGVEGARILLLTQPGFLGHVFNPVSFWLAMRGESLLAVIAEVTNTYGDRHSYFCARPDLMPIGPQDRLAAQKRMYVSPFQEVAGGYSFNFHIRPDRIAIRIDYRNGARGLVATMAGRRAPLTNAAILGALLRRPAGGLRTLALIHWQAVRLKLKGAHFRRRPTPPAQEIS